MPGVLGSHFSQNYNKELKFVNLPLHFEKMSRVAPGDSPTLGQHNQEILSELYDADYIAFLIKNEII